MPKIRKLKKNDIKTNLGRRRWKLFASTHNFKELVFVRGASKGRRRRIAQRKVETEAKRSIINSTTSAQQQRGWWREGSNCFHGLPNIILKVRLDLLPLILGSSSTTFFYFIERAQEIAGVDSHLHFRSLLFWMDMWVCGMGEDKSTAQAAATFISKNPRLLDILVTIPSSSAIFVFNEKKIK